MNDDPLFSWGNSQPEKKKPEQGFPLSRADQIEARFQKFHLDNPGIWKLFEGFSMEMIKAGKSNYSSAAIFERIRWHISISTTDQDCKLSNCFKPYYARLFHKLHPEHKNFFIVKKLTTKDKSPIYPDRHYFHSPPETPES